MWFVSIIIGILSVLCGVLILRRELNQAIRAIPKDMDSVVKRNDLEELNASFFDIANDLEGKYSIHEKQIQKMEAEVEKMHAKQRQLDIALTKNANREGNDKDMKRYVRRVPLKTEILDTAEIEDVKCFEHSETEGEFSKKREAQILLEKGHSVPEIAKKLEMGVSELQLMLGMKKY